MTAYDVAIDVVAFVAMVIALFGIDQLRGAGRNWWPVALALALILLVMLELANIEIKIDDLQAALPTPLP